MMITLMIVVTIIRALKVSDRLNQARYFFLLHQLFFYFLTLYVGAHGQSQTPPYTLIPGLNKSFFLCDPSCDQCVQFLVPFF